MLGGGEAEALRLQAEMLLTDVPINTPPYLQEAIRDSCGRVRTPLLSNPYLALSRSPAHAGGRERGHHWREALMLTGLQGVREVLASVPQVTTFRGEAGPQGIRVPGDGSGRLPAGAPSRSLQWPEHVHRVRSCHAPGRPEVQRQVLLAGMAWRLPLTRLPESGWVVGGLGSGKF